MDEHTWHSIHECKGRTCPFYPRVCSMMHDGVGWVTKGETPTDGDLRDIFHTECDTCRTLDQQHHSLCTYCEHLRPHHLFVCLRDAEADRIPVIDLGLIEDIDKGQHCMFCRFVSKMFQSRKGYQRDLRYIILVTNHFLSSPRLHTRVSLSSDTPDHLLYFMAIMWANAAHRLMPYMQRFATVRSLDHGQRNDRESYKQPGLALSSCVDWSKAANWLQHCASNHRHILKHQSANLKCLPNRFKLIDIDQKCIVPAPEDPRFAALSYVWGKRQENELEIVKSNLATVCTSGYLVDENLPRTIADAMTVCGKLRVSYLWVDRLCIVQDDASQKHSQIAAMDVVYGAAVFTICAAAGDSSHYGLPGVRPGSQTFRRVRAELPGVEMEQILPDLDDCLQDGAWIRRGWAYQELSLSTRLLLFTDWQLFFECSRTTATEEPLTAVTKCWSFNLLTSDPGTRQNHVVRPKFALYMVCAQAYAQRMLSFESDVYNAFTGIFRHIYTDLESYICGLPEKDFDSAILWESVSFHEPTHVEGAVLPTWAWASQRQGGVYWFASVIGTVARWAVRDDRGGGGGLRLLQSTRDPSERQLGSLWSLSPKKPRAVLDARQYMLAAWPVCIESPSPRTAERELRGGNKAWLRSRWRSYKEFWEEAHGDSHAFPASRTAMELLAAKPGRLLDRAGMVSLKLFRRTLARSSDLQTLDFDMFDTNGSQCVGYCKILFPFAVAGTRMTRSGVVGVFNALALCVGVNNDNFTERVKRGDQNGGGDLHHKGRS